MEAEEAIYAMNGYNYNGNKLVVELAEGKKNKENEREKRRSSGRHRREVSRSHQ
jgi:RNA recognition motif-containing protein